MLDENDLQAIAQLMDTKIRESESRIKDFVSTEVDTKIKESEGRMKDFVETKVNESEGRMLAYIEADILPRFDMLAEGQQLLRQTLAPKERVAALEDEVSFMKQVIKSMARDIEALKKAQ